MSFGRRPSPLADAAYAGTARLRLRGPVAFKLVDVFVMTFD